jgi:Fe2+ transport system protein FeoA
LSVGGNGFETRAGELAEALRVADDGGGVRVDELRTRSVHDDDDRALRTLVERGLVRIDGEPAVLTREGREHVGRDVHPVSQLGNGHWGRVVCIRTRDTAHKVKLSSMGLMPGALIRMMQKRPATVIQVSETKIALDLDIASGILVRRVE